MSADTIGIAKVVDRQAAAVERKLAGLRNEQRDRLRAIRQLEKTRSMYERQLRQLAYSVSGATTAQRLCDVSLERSSFEVALREVSVKISRFRIDVERLRQQHSTLFKSLVSLRRKAEFMRQRTAKIEKKKAKRRFHNDVIADSLVVIK